MSLDVKTTQKFFNDNVSWTLTPGQKKGVEQVAMASGRFFSFFGFNFWKDDSLLCILLIRLDEMQLWKKWWGDWNTIHFRVCVLFVKKTIIPKKLIDYLAATEMMIILESSNSAMIIQFLGFVTTGISSVEQ